MNLHGFLGSLAHLDVDEFHEQGEGDGEIQVSFRNLTDAIVEDAEFGIVAGFGDEHKTDHDEE